MGCSNPKTKTSAVAGGELPDDPLVEILSRLSIKDLHRSKCVARAWRDLVDGPHHRTRLPQTLEGFFFMDEDNYSRGGRFGFVSLLSRSVVDTSFSFLMSRRPEIKVLTPADSCNGLFLFDHGLRSSEPSDRFGYVVCNPATKHWVTVPRCDVYASSRGDGPRYSYLLFDPAASSSHFHLVQFWSEYRSLVAESSEESEHEQSSSEEESEDEHSSSSEDSSSMSEMDEGNPGCRRMGRSDELSSEEEEWSSSGEEDLSRISVHTYSSETGMWTHIPIDLDEQGLEEWRNQGSIPSRGPRRAFLNGMLHIMISDKDEIAAVDARGATQYPAASYGEWEALAGAWLHCSVPRAPALHQSRVFW